MDHRIEDSKEERSLGFLIKVSTTKYDSLQLKQYHSVTKRQIHNARKAKYR